MVGLEVGPVPSSLRGHVETEWRDLLWIKTTESQTFWGLKSTLGRTLILCKTSIKWWNHLLACFRSSTWRDFCPLSFFGLGGEDTFVLDLWDLQFVDVDPAQRAEDLCIYRNEHIFGTCPLPLPRVYWSSPRTRKVKPSNRPALEGFLQGTSVENHCSHASPVSLCPQYKQLCILSTARGWVDVCRETNVLL